MSRTAIVCLLAATVTAWSGGASASGLSARVESLAAEAARGQVAAPDRFEVISARFGGADPVGAESPQLALLEADGPNASGIVRVVLSLRVGGVPKGTARATVRGRVLGPALVAATTLRAGQELQDPPGVDVREADLTRLAAPPLRRIEELEDRVPTRTLGPGRVLTTALLRAAPVVRRGQVVDLVVRKGKLVVRTLGTALRDGAPGEIVPAENRRTRVRLVARVEADGSLSVLRAGSGR